MDTRRLDSDTQGGLIRLALLGGDPWRAAALLHAWIASEGGSPQLRRLAMALDDLDDAWPEWLESSQGQGELRGLAEHPLLRGPRLD